MLKTLHSKLVVILVTLVVSVMAVVGTFLINSVTEYHISKFKTEMSGVFTQDLILYMEQVATTPNGATALRDYVMVHSGALGINKNRNLYVLDGKTGKYISGSDDGLESTMELTSNVLSAMTGIVGDEISPMGKYFDVAIPVVAKDASFVVGVLDNRNDLNAFTWNLIGVLLKAMFFGVVIVILLSLILSKMITNPVEKLIVSAKKLSEGDFGSEISVESGDEIGVLTQTFNTMAVTLKETLDAVEGERNKLNTMFAHLKDGVCAFDKNGHMIHINPSAKKMLGKDAAIGGHYRDVFKNLLIDESDLNESGDYIEVDYATPGSVLKIFMAPFDSGDGGGLISVVHDITEQSRLDNSRREFVANVSHELRTPLTNIKGYTETLLAADDLDSETKKSFLSVVYSEADRMTRIVKDLLTLSRLDHGKMEMRFSSCDVVQTVKTTGAAMVIEAKNQGITLECTGEGPIMIMGDNERLAQVIVNITSNAIKYNQPGGNVAISVKEDKGFAKITIKDTGMGIPAEDLPRIFERFYRVDKARSREKGGTGLGLAIAKEIIEQHDGSVNIESTYGIGTAITVSLPILKEDKAL